MINYSGSGVEEFNFGHLLYFWSFTILLVPEKQKKSKSYKNETIQRFESKIITRTTITITTIILSNFNTRQAVLREGSKLIKLTSVLHWYFI